jgi:hypothetical protein
LLIDKFSQHQGYNLAACPVASYLETNLPVPEAGICSVDPFSALEPYTLCSTLSSVGPHRIAIGSAKAAIVVTSLMVVGAVG